MPAEYPYPNPFEILRYVLRSFDLKQSNKRLDELAAKKIYDPRELEFAIEQYFTKIAEKYMGRTAAKLISNAITTYFEEYLQKIAGKIAADGVSRTSTLELLIKTSIKYHLVDLVKKLHNDVGGPHPSFWFATEKSSVGALFEWIQVHESNWASQLAGCSKERRDMISAWMRGKELPSAQSILLLSAPCDTQKPDYIGAVVEPLIFISRAIDFIKQEPLGMLLLEESRLSMWGADNNESLHSGMRAIQTKISGTNKPLLISINKIRNGLMRTVEKSEPDEYKSIISQARTLTQQSEHLDTTTYCIDWHDARWHVFSGNLKRANDLYKSAFENALFLAGDNQKLIIEEAIVVAANQPTPDGVFLKKLKWSLINFGYDIPSISDKRPSQKISDSIEDWEIDLWKSSFNIIFPKSGLFSGVDYSSLQHNAGPLITSDSTEISPDYRYPNRTIKIGETWQRSMPQLVWFAMKENVEICRNLIERGADVNVQSDVGDTPILLAIEALNATAVPWRSLNNELFNLISKEQHTAKIINTRCQKKRNLPLISAVRTGRPEIVEKILEMGADPNARGLTDEQTALNECIKLIGVIKNHDLFLIHQRSMPVTPEALDAVRRHSSGLSGFTLNHQNQFIEQSYFDPRFKDFTNTYMELFSKRILENVSIESMRNIARQLIASGADVNAAHASPVKGYTPMMLAAELDERMIFEFMLVSGGDIKKTYINPNNRKSVSIHEIANFFQSHNVLNVLEDISPYISGI